jgi:hypothetical protein
MKLLKKLFNLNRGYWIETHLYQYKGKLEIGYVLYQGYTIFGINGKDRINVYVDLKDAKEDLEKLNLTD